ncbi:MAG: hypothetical protein LC096_09815 [Bacteroidia bacterium]|nr:hypothetical protein [Bacteroidia bacterium]
MLKNFNCKPLILILSSAILFANNTSAQSNYDSYEEEYRSLYLNGYSEDDYRREEEKKYKRTYNEEDLYNGRYRNKSYNNSSNGYSSNSVFGWDNITGKKNKESEDIIVETEKEIPKKKFNRWEGIENGLQENTKDKDNLFSGILGFISPDKEKHQPETKEPEIKGPPPMPDEPDVPINQYSIVLFLLGLLYVSKNILQTKITN